jgi:hypothetical protein
VRWRGAASLVVSEVGKGAGSVGIVELEVVSEGRVVSSAVRRMKK